MCDCHKQGCCGSSSKSGCGCSSSGCGCGSSCQCSSSCGCRGGSKQGSCDYAAKFLEVADHAWIEVLKDKIKEQIKADGKHMDELARVIAEANKDKWQSKMAAKQKCCGYEEKLKEFFHSSRKNGKCT